MLTFFGKTEEGMKLGREEVHNTLDTGRNNKTQVFFFFQRFYRVSSEGNNGFR